jgi:signal transduction histidine kinase
MDKGPGRRETLLASVDDRMVCLMRLILAASALVVTFVAPSEPDRLPLVTYSALFLYTLYSAALYIASRRLPTIRRSKAVHWVDVGWYLLLISLSSGTSSIFFFFFFFAILVASFRWGFGEGLRVTAISAVLFTVIGYATALAGPQFEWARFLLRPIYLVALGYMVAYWGGAEIKLRRRLMLLKEVNSLSNPRFGIAHTTLGVMKLVRSFYDAEACLLVLGVRDQQEFHLNRVARAASGGGEEVEVLAEQIPPELARQFFTLPETTAVVYNAKVRPWQRPEACYYALDLKAGQKTERGHAESEALAALLDAEAFVMLPLMHRGKLAGRLFLTGRAGAFETSDVDFLQQVVEHVMPVLSNVRLLDQLAAKAAEQERQRIARDLHDSVIQPYIGLQYKLAAIRNQLASGAHDVGEEIERLFDLTTSEVTGLRHYVRGLKESAGAGQELELALRRYAEQFQENYGIDVGVVLRNDVRVTSRLAAEVIQMVHEALRNAWKHTEAMRCTVSLETSDNHLELSVENDGAGRDAESFTPRSISERAEALGGHVQVERGGDATSVKVRIPL